MKICVLFGFFFFQFSNSDLAHRDILTACCSNFPEAQKNSPVYNICPCTLRQRVRVEVCLDCSDQFRCYSGLAASSPLKAVDIFFRTQGAIEKVPVSEH